MDNIYKVLSLVSTTDNVHILPGSLIGLPNPKAEAWLEAGVIERVIRPPSADQITAEALALIEEPAEPASKAKAKS